MKEQKSVLVNFRVSPENKKWLNILLQLKDIGTTEFFTGIITASLQFIEAEGGIDAAVEKHQEAKAKQHQALQSALEKLTQKNIV